MDICANYPEGIMKLPVYDASVITKGQLLKWGADAGTYNGTVLNSLLDVANTAADAFAVALEGLTTLVASNRQTPYVYRVRCRILNNPSIMKIYYDMSTSVDLDMTSATTSTVITTAANDDDLDGGWVYINSGTGAGQLRYIKASTTTTITVNTAFTTTPNSTSDFIIIRSEGCPLDGIALNTTFDKILPVLNETDATKIIVLENHVIGPMGDRVLNITDESDLECDGLNNTGVRFYSLAIIGDGALWATGF